MGFTYGVEVFRFWLGLLLAPSCRGRLSPNPYPPRPAYQSCEIPSFLTNSSP